MYRTSHSLGARSTVFKSRISTAALALGISMAASPAIAQDDNANDPNVIVVTAQLREQNVQDTPLSITAVSGELLEARSQTKLTDIAAQAPNVLLQQNPSGSGASMRAYIRGVGQADQSPSVEPGVGIYVDDIYFGTVTASAFDLTDLERVEVLRGPQGTLAGMNSQGGAIKLYSRKPQGEGGFVEATLGASNRVDLKASADFTVVEDAVFARVTGVMRNRDGYVSRYDYACLNPNDPYVQPGTSAINPSQAAIPQLASGDCKLGTLGAQSMFAVRGSLRIAPQGSPLEINITGDYTKDTSETPASTLIASAEITNRQNGSVAYQGVPFDNRFVTYGQYRRDGAVLNDPFASYANFYDPGVTYRAVDAAATPGAPNGPVFTKPANQVEGWGVSGIVDYEVADNIAFKSITGYRTYDSFSSDDNDNSPVAFIGAVPSYFSHKQFSQEVRLSGNFMEDALNVTVGGIYYDASTRYNGRIHSPFSGFGTPQKPTFSFINDDTADMTVWAGFGNASWQMAPGLTLEGGIRVTSEQKDYTYGRYNPDGVGDYLPLSNPANPLSGQVGSYKETIVDYRAVLSYKITPDVMAYAQFATGHKAGGVAPRPYSYYQIRSFGPEKLNSYEVGFKADLFDRILRINASAFYMDYVGYQGTPQTCLDEEGNPLPVDKGGVEGLCGQYLNLGDARVKGFELETTLRPIEGLTIDGSLSLTDFEFTKVNYPTTSIVVGSSRPGIGDWKWSIGAQYEILLGDAGTLTPRIDVAYTPGYCGNFACNEISKVDSYTLANARLTYQTEDKDWSVALEVTNLFDKFYYLNKFYNGWFALGQPGRPREWAVSVKRRF
ncbi:MAG TPA: TonB-dependent receptor [Sphingomonadaceae bacterium]|nr:TonB-dependent receptor [Sphingomonadaceae bacterium]